MDRRSFISSSVAESALSPLASVDADGCVKSFSSSAGSIAQPRPKCGVGRGSSFPTESTVTVQDSGWETVGERIVRMARVAALMHLGATVDEACAEAEA